MSNRKATDFEKLHPSGDEPHLLREIIRTYQVLMTGFSREIGVPASRLALMRILAVTEADLGVMDIARLLGINAAAVTRHVQALERERLIQRRTDPKDGRRSYLKLSPKGRTLFKKIHERSHELERSLSSIISAEEMAVATTILMKLRTFVENLR